MIGYFPPPELAPKPPAPEPDLVVETGARPRDRYTTAWGRWGALLSEISELPLDRAKYLSPALSTAQISTLRSAAKYQGIGLHVRQYPPHRPTATVVWRKGPREKFNRRRYIKKEV